MLELRHPNILTLCGARAHPPEYYLLFPFQENGSVASLIHDRGWRPSASAVVTLLAQVAAAMAYVHSRGYVHRDLKPSNVLLGADWVARLCDFGLAEDEAALRASLQAAVYSEEDAEGNAVAGRYLSDKTHAKTHRASAPSGGFQKQHMVGTLAYMAPEVLMRRVPSFPADAYAFGVFSSEALTRVVPYADRERNVALAHTVLDLSYNEQDLAKAIASEGLRPSLPSAEALASGRFGDEADADAIRDTARLCERCWAREPGERPTFAAIEAEVASIRSAFRIAKGLRPDAPLEPRWVAPSAETVAARETSAAGRAEVREGGGGRGETRDRVRSRPPRGLPRIESATRPFRPGAFATCGARGADKMEDRHVVQRDVGGIAGAHVVAVFDGHRGFECAEFAKNRFVDALVARFARRVRDEDASSATNAEPSEDAPAEALREAFLDVHAAFCAAHERASATADAENADASHASASARRRFPGCAATAALVWGDYLYVANAGDCRAVLCRDDRDAADAAMVAMSEDHSAATNAAERARIESVAGPDAIRRVGGGDADENAAAASYRVGPAGLAVTRALGDADCSAYGVTAEPEVRRVRLTPRDAYVVVACDGFWDVVSAPEVGAMLRDTVKEPSMCAKRLGSEALTRMSGDNITVIVAFLKDVDTAETVTWERSFRSALT